MVKVKGIGGIFFKCDNPDELKQWYKEHLGFNVDEYGCITFDPKTLPEKSYVIWSPFKADTDYFQPSKQSRSH